MKAFALEVSKEQPSAFGQADLLCEKQTSRKQSSGCQESTVCPCLPMGSFCWRLCPKRQLPCHRKEVQVVGEDPASPLVSAEYERVLSQM